MMRRVVTTAVSTERFFFFAPDVARDNAALCAVIFFGGSGLPASLHSEKSRSFAIRKGRCAAFPPDRNSPPDRLLLRPGIAPKLLFPACSSRALLCPRRCKARRVLDVPDHPGIRTRRSAALLRPEILRPKFRKGHVSEQVLASLFRSSLWAAVPVCSIFPPSTCQCPSRSPLAPAGQIELFAPA